MPPLEDVIRNTPRALFMDAAERFHSVLETVRRSMLIPSRPLSYPQYVHLAIDRIIAQRREDAITDLRPALTTLEQKTAVHARSAITRHSNRRMFPRRQVRPRCRRRRHHR
jgi:hypothetical protein